MAQVAKNRNNRLDLNGNTTPTKYKQKQIETVDGRIFYPCQYCHKVFKQKTACSHHMQNECKAKQYDFSSESDKETAKPKAETPRRRKRDSEAERSAKQAKISIQQNIVIKKSHSSCSSEPPSVSDEEERPARDPAHKCVDCDRIFRDSIELLRHTRKLHTYPKVIVPMAEIKKYFDLEDRDKCPICHKPLKTKFKSAFLKHLNTHSNEVNFKCKICKKQFTRVDHMKAHEKRHVKGSEELGEDDL